MRNQLLTVAIIMAGLSLAPVAQAEPLETVRPAHLVSTLIKRAAIVEAVNKETRELKLIDSQGHRFSVIAGEVVRNFDQIEARDRIVAEYIESVAIVVAPSGAPEAVVGDAELVAVAARGEKPAFADVETLQVTGTVESINTTDRRATLSFETGEVRTINVRPEVNLNLVEVGDQVRLRITRAMAVSVVKPDS